MIAQQCKRGERDGAVLKLDGWVGMSGWIGVHVTLAGQLGCPVVPIVAAAAGARIDHGDLTALLYAQGIARSEWVEG